MKTIDLGAGWTWIAACAVLLVGCEPAVEDTELDGPCADGWGAIPADVAAAHVRGDAEAGGDGSFDAPFSTVEDGLAATRATDGPRLLALGPGSWSGAFVLGGAEHPEDSGLQIVGCGPEVSVITAVDVVPNDGGDPVRGSAFSLTGPLDDVLIEGLTLSSGRRTVSIAAGAGADGAIVLRDLVIEDAIRLGVLVHEAGPVHIEDVEVRAVQAEASWGWGIAFDAQVGFGEEPVTSSVIDCEVSDASGVGIFAHAATLDISRTTVRDTVPVDGFLGRGVHYQMRASGRLDSLDVVGNSDAGIYLLKPGEVILRDSSIRGTLASDVQGQMGVRSGDGLATAQDGNAIVDPATFIVRVEGTSFEDNERAGVVAEDVTWGVGADNVFSTNGIFAKGSTFPVADTFLLQGAAILTGFDEGGEPDSEGFELDPTQGWEPLEVFRPPLTPEFGR